MSTKTSEIGSVQKLDLDEEYLVHIQANHLEFARFLKKVQEEVKDDNNKSLSQRGIAKHLRGLGMKITQPQVSRHLSVLTLSESYIQMIENRHMSFLAGHKLSKLTDEEKEEVYQVALGDAMDKAEEKGDSEPVVKIYERHIDQIRRANLSSVDIFKYLHKQSDFTEPYETAPDGSTEEAPMKGVMVRDQVLIDGSELSSTIGLLKMRASSHPEKNEEGDLVGGRIKPTDLNMYVNQTKHVQLAIQAVSDAIKEELEKQGYRVY